MTGVRYRDGIRVLLIVAVLVSVSRVLEGAADQSLLAQSEPVDIYLAFFPELLRNMNADSLDSASRAVSTIGPTPPPSLTPGIPSQVVYANCVQTSMTDIDRDGVVNEIEHRHYDGDGFLVRYESAQPSTGLTTNIEMFDYEDRLLVQTRYDRPEIGSVDFVIDHFYSGTLLIREEFDSDNDGSIDDIRVREFDSLEQLVSDSMDRGNDGRFDRVYWFFHESGSLQRVEYDIDGDMNIDSTQVNVLGPDGHLEWVEFLDRFGNLDRRTHFDYDGLGLLTLEEQYSGEASDPHSTTSYEYDTRWRLIHRETRHSFGGLERGESHRYDSLNRPIFSEFHSHISNWTVVHAFACP